MEQLPEHYKEGWHMQVDVTSCVISCECLCSSLSAGMCASPDPLENMS